MAVIDDVRLKIVRAREHRDEIADKVSKYLEGKPYEWLQEQDPGGAQKIRLYWRVHREPDPYLGTVIGDYVNNCRAALDYIAHALHKRAGGDGRPYFPLWETESQFMAKAVPIFKILPPEQLTVLESVQPFNGQKRPVRMHAGCVLVRLSREDKHHAITTSLFAPDHMRITLYDGLGRLVQTRKWDLPQVPIEDNATIAVIDVPQVPPPDVQVQADIQSRLHVVGEGVAAEVLQPLLTYVQEDVFKRFEPILKKLA